MRLRDGRCFLDRFDWPSDHLPLVSSRHRSNVAPYRSIGGSRLRRQCRHDRQGGGHRHRTGPACHTLSGSSGSLSNGRSLTMSTCTKWVNTLVISCKDWSAQLDYTCTTWADHGSDECSQWADEGSNQCTSWEECHWYT